MPDPRSPAEVLEAVKATYDLIDGEAEAIDDAGTLTETAVATLHEAGAFHFLVPRELGGTEVDAITALEIFEETGRANPSAGWVVQVNAAVTGGCAVHLNDRGAEQIVGDGRGICSGFFAGGGVAKPVEGGYLFSGKFRFGSGSGHSTWVGGLGYVLDPGEDPPNPAPPPGPKSRPMFVPHSKVRFMGGWDDVVGLRGTGSFDYEVDEQFVAEDFTFASPGPLRGGPMGKFGMSGFINLGLAGWPIGVAQRALDETIAMASSVTRFSAGPGGHSIGRQQTFQHDFAYHEAAVDAARAYVRQVHADAATYLRDNDVVVLRASPIFPRVAQCHTWASRVCLDAVRWCYQVVGTRAIHSSPIQRCLRDLLVGTQHTSYGDTNFIRRTQARLAPALEPEPATGDIPRKGAVGSAPSVVPSAGSVWVST